MRPPSVIRDAIPQNEHVHADVIEGNFTLLWQLLLEFEATLGLSATAYAMWRKQSDLIRPRLEQEGEQYWKTTEFVLARKQMDMYQHWWKIAGTNGAIILQGVFEIMAKNLDVANEAPTIRSKIDKRKRRTSQKLFESFFPGIEDLRHTAAHPEYNVTPKELKEHPLAADADVGGARLIAQTLLHATVFMANEEMTFASTVRGKPLHYKLVQASMDKLVRVVELYWDAFSAVCGPRQAARSEQLRPEG